jgi:hypothetical protein
MRESAMDRARCAIVLIVTASWFLLVLAACGGSKGAQGNPVSPSAVSVQITPPDGWTSAPLDSGDTAFFPPGVASDPGLEYSGDIIVTRYANQAGATLQAFLSQAAPFLFTTSESIATTQINGHPAIRFTGVSGMLLSNVLAVDVQGTIVQLTDVGQLHDVDQQIDKIAASIP